LPGISFGVRLGSGTSGGRGRGEGDGSGEGDFGSAGILRRDVRPATAIIHSHKDPAEE